MVILAHLVISFFASAEGPSINYVLCKLKGNVRTVRIDVDDQKTCHTIYSKAGVEKEIGSGRNKGSCDHFLDNVRINLEKSNWKCHDITSATVSESGN